MSEAKIKTALGRGGGMIVFTGQLLYYNLYFSSDYKPHQEARNQWKLCYA